MQDSQSHSSDRQYAAYSLKIFISTVAHFLSFEAFSRMEFWRERKQTDTVQSMQGAFMDGICHGAAVPPNVCDFPQALDLNQSATSLRGSNFSLPLYKQTH